MNIENIQRTHDRSIEIWYRQGVWSQEEDAPKLLLKLRLKVRT